MIHEEITRDIIGAAMEVLNELKPGLDEKLYERALILNSKGVAIPSTNSGSSPCIIEVSISGK